MALNDQLLDELPQLYSMSRHLLQLCINTLTRAQQRFYHAALTEMYQMLGVSLQKKVITPKAGRGWGM